MNEQEFKAYIVDQYPNEAVGIELLDGNIVTFDNIASNPKGDFLIEGASLFNYYGEIGFILHSHTHKKYNHLIDERAPSYRDLEQHQIFMLPGKVYHCDGVNVSEPIVFNDDGVIEPLLGRQFCHNANDCWELCRDFFQLYIYEQLPIEEIIATEEALLIDSYKVGNVPRDPDWFFKRIPLFTNHYEQLNFVTTNVLTTGCMLLMAIESFSPNHCAIYLGCNEILHHLPGRLSCIEPYGSYQKSVTHVLRYRL